MDEIKHTKQITVRGNFQNSGISFPRASSVGLRKVSTVHSFTVWHPIRRRHEVGEFDYALKARRIDQASGQSISKYFKSAVATEGLVVLFAEVNALSMLPVHGRLA